MKIWMALIAVGSLAFSSCSKGKDEPATKGDPMVKEGGRSVTINGSGSTFQKAFQESAVEVFTKQNPGLKINYGGGGSGKGRQDLADMVTDFAGSDSPFKDADLGKVKGGDLLYFPVVLGAV